MSSAAHVDPVDQKTIRIKAQRRIASDISLVAGIVAITLFLALFVWQFSKILNLAGKVNHAPRETYYAPVGD